MRFILPSVWFASLQGGIGGEILLCQLENKSCALSFLLIQVGVCVCVCVKCRITSLCLSLCCHCSMAHQHYLIRPLWVCNHHSNTHFHSLSPLDDTPTERVPMYLPGSPYTCLLPEPRTKLLRWVSLTREDWWLPDMHFREAEGHWGKGCGHKPFEESLRSSWLLVHSPDSGASGD